MKFARTCIALAAIIALSLGACATEPSPTSGVVQCPMPPKPVTGWGHFNGTPIQVEWREDGRCMTLLADFHYVDKRGRDWSAKKGDKTDGASIPKALWSVVGGPYEGLYRDAAVFHDVECARRPHTATWQDTHRMFLEAMLCDGVEERQAKTMFAAVYRFGPKWSPPKVLPARAPAALGMTTTAQLATPEVTIQRPCGEPGQDQIRRIDRWIKRSNPSPETIERAMETGQIPSR